MLLSVLLSVLLCLVKVSSDYEGGGVGGLVEVLLGGWGVSFLPRPGLLRGPDFEAPHHLQASSKRGWGSLLVVTCVAACYSAGKQHLGT